MKNNKLLVFLVMNIAFFLYSLSSVCSKSTSLVKSFSLTYIVLYGMVLVLLFVYAFLWQKVLKYMPLSIAYANKAVVVIWGILWGIIFFKEKIRITGIVGVVLIIAGILILSKEETA